MSVSYRSAILSAASSALGGVGGWRLPRVSELQTIMSDTDNNGSLDQLDPAFPWGPGRVDDNPPKPFGNHWTSDFDLRGQHSFLSGGGAGNQIQIRKLIIMFGWSNDLSSISIPLAFPESFIALNGNVVPRNLARTWFVLGPGN